MERNVRHKESTWELKTIVSQQTFKNFDFTKTNFNSAIFNNVNFINCLFDKSNLSGSKLYYNSNFSDCTFTNVDLSSTTFGSHKGLYENCIFNKCNFKGKEFNFTRYVKCFFDACKLKKINFNASSFANCKFTGSMDDVTFNGMYDTNKSSFPVLDNVDFSDAKLGEFVTFIDCDLSNCTAPTGSTFDEILYNLYSDDSSVLSTGSKDRIVLSRK